MQEFIDKIRWIRSEILALKQSATKGINSISFYSAYNEYLGAFVTGATMLTTTVHFDSSVTTQPMCQIYMNSARFLNISTPIWDASAHTLRTITTAWEPASYDCTVYVVATQPISSITREVVKNDF